MTKDDIIKTGTTCIGLKFKEGVILAADRRVSTYKIESDSFTKIFNLSKNIVCTVAGQAAPAQLFMRYIKSEIRLLELKNERSIRVQEAAMILNSLQYSAIRSQGAVVSCIMGGYDTKNKNSLYHLSPDGTIVSNKGYVTTGSGSLYVKGLLDTEYGEGLSKKDAQELIHKAFSVAFKNDSASGGGYILKTITKDGIEETSQKIVKSDIVEEKK